MSKCFLETRWWRWGDLEKDSKGKKLHIWHENHYEPEKPELDDSWTLGEDPGELEWEDITEGGKVPLSIFE